jgi:hypothetical protein
MHRDCMIRGPTLLAHCGLSSENGVPAGRNRPVAREPVRIASDPDNSTQDVLGGGLVLAVMLPLTSWVTFWGEQWHGRHGSFFGLHGMEHHFSALTVVVFAVYASFATLLLVLLGAGVIWIARRPAVSIVWVGAGAFWALVAVVSVSSGLYYSVGGIGHWSPGLSHVDAIYVAVGTLTTAGASGIVPTSNLTRALVVTQMLADIVLFTIMGAVVLDRLTQRRQPAM